MKNVLVVIAIFLVATTQGQVVHNKVDYTKPMKYKGNIFTFHPTLSLPVQGKIATSIPGVKTINGKKIYNLKNSYDIPLRNYSNLSEYIFQQLKPVFQKLPDGNYVMSTHNMVVNEKGNLVFYDFREITPVSGKMHSIKGEGDIHEVASVIHQASQKRNRSKEEIVLSEHFKKQINDAMINALENVPPFSPVVVDGRKVNYMLDYKNNFKALIIVKNQVANLEIL